MLKQLSSHENLLAAIKTQLSVGDFFICAGEKQRDYWLGMLSSLGRINPYTYQDDPSLRRLIDVVPFGLPQIPPRHTRPVLKGVYKTIAQDDKVILWSGGLWKWFDAPTLIRAMAIVCQKRTDIKLFFMGVNRPNQNVAQTMVANEIINLSKDLGLYEQYVFFNDWVPYNERQDYLLEADIGISLHLDYIETRFAFRTRLLDHLWAALPTIASKGDVLGEMMATHKLAYLVEPNDAEGVAQAILTLLNTPNLRAHYASRFEEVAAHYHWEKVLHPLIAFCANPHPAADKAYINQNRISNQGPTAWWQLPAKSWRALQLGGTTGLWQQAKEYVQWKTGKN